MKYPPFCDIIVIGISSKEEKFAQKVTKVLHQYLKNRVITENIGIILYQGMPAPIDKIKNNYRWRIIIKCKFDESIIKLMEDTLEQCSGIKECKNGDTRVSIDLNPTSMM